MFFNKSKRLLQEKELELETALAKIASQEKELQAIIEKNDSYEKKLSAYEKEFTDIIDKNSVLAEKNTLIEETQKRLAELNETYQKGLNLHKSLEDEMVLYQDNLEIRSYGLHTPKFSFDTSEKFKYALEKKLRRAKTAYQN